jgi:Phage major capsid protein E
MPSPTSLQVHVNRPLTMMSVANVQTSDKFVALRVFPGLNVPNKSDRYIVYSQADLMRDEMQERSPGTQSAGGGYTIDNTPSYSCVRYAWHYDVDDDTVANADQPLRPTQDAGVFLAQKVLIKHETLFASTYFTTSVWTGSSTASDLVAGTDFTAWDDVTSTPLEDIDAQKESIEAKTGQLPNKLCLNRVGWNALRNHPDIVDRVKHTSSEAISRGIVARLMELDEIVVGAGVRNTAQKNLAGAYSYILGNHALLAYVPPSPSLMTPSAGYTFRWSGLPGSVDGQAVSTFRMPELKSDRHEVEMNIDMKVVSATCGAFFSSVAS